MQSFQGGVPEVYKEECPLAGILSAVYVVRIVDQLQLCGVVLAFYVNHYTMYNHTCRDFKYTQLGHNDGVIKAAMIV